MATKGKKVKRERRVRQEPQDPGAVAGRPADEITDIVRTLEYTIKALKSADCPPGCDHINSSIEMYEWALGEFKQARDDAIECSHVNDINVSHAARRTSMLTGNGAPSRRMAVSLEAGCHPRTPGNISVPA